MQILRKACLGLLRLFGWRTSLTWPPEPRGLIMVYPHTSNWDFPLGVLFKLGHALPAHWMGKDQMFRWPFRRLPLPRRPFRSAPVRPFSAAGLAVPV